MTDTFRIATYNVENLFNRFAPTAAHQDAFPSRPSTTPLSRARRTDLAKRIHDSRADVIGLQEVDSLDALVEFAQDTISPRFDPATGVVSQPGNDTRGIDLGLLSTFPLGRVTSHRFNEFTTPAGRTARFSRDCLQVEILTRDRSAVLLTAFICHFKSKHSPYDPVTQPDNHARDQARADDTRQGEAQEVVRLIREQLTPGTDRFVVMGDLNDTPDSPALAPLCSTLNALGLINASSHLPQPDTSPESAAPRPRDTHLCDQFDPVEGQHKARWAQTDHLLCSPALWARSTGRVEVINSPQDQGSRHYITWAEFTLPSDIAS